MNRDLKIVSAAIFIWALGEGLFISLTPLYLAELGAGPERIGLLTALFSLAQALVMIPAGIASDRWGPRKLLVGGWLMGSLMALLMAFSPGLELFALGYVGFGFTSWVMPPLTSIIANGRGDLTPERAFSRVYSFFWAGLIISPTLGGLIGELYGLRTTYVAATALFFISTLMISRLGPGQPRPRELGGGGHSTLVRQRGYLYFLGIVFFISFVLWLGMPLAPNLLQERWDVPISRIGALSSVASLGGVVLALSLEGKGPRRALLAVHAAVFGYMVILMRRGVLCQLAVGNFIQAGSGIARQFMDAITTRIVKPSQLGLAYALNGTVGRAAVMAASALAGLLYAIRPAFPFQVGLVLIPLAAGLTWWKAPRGGDGASVVE